MSVPSPLPRSLTEEIEWLLSTPSVRETENKKMGAEVSHRTPYLRYTASIPLVTSHYITLHCCTASIPLVTMHYITLHHITLLYCQYTPGYYALHHITSQILELLNTKSVMEQLMVEKFQSAGGSQLREFCSHKTKEQCRRERGSSKACGKLHFRRWIPHYIFRLFKNTLLNC